MKTINTSKPTKKREKLVGPDIFSPISYNIDHSTQIQYLNNLYLDISFNEKTCTLKELRLKQTSVILQPKKLLLSFVWLYISNTFFAQISPLCQASRCN